MALNLETRLVGLSTGSPLVLPSFCLNSANPVASEHEFLLRLSESRFAAGVTSRTSMLNGFDHDDEIHRWSMNPQHSLNCYGYSPHSYEYYASISKRLTEKGKPYFMSITGSSSEVRQIISAIESGPKQQRPTAFEINLSCPNIPGEPPCAYEAEKMKNYLEDIIVSNVDDPVPIGLKLPPYFYDTQFTSVAEVINGIHQRQRGSFGCMCDISSITQSSQSC